MKFRVISYAHKYALCQLANIIIIAINKIRYKIENLLTVESTGKVLYIQYKTGQYYKNNSKVMFSCLTGKLVRNIE